MRSVDLVTLEWYSLKWGLGFNAEPDTNKVVYPFLVEVLLEENTSLLLVMLVPICLKSIVIYRLRNISTLV